MAINAFDIIAGAVEQQKKRVFGDLNLLKRFQQKVNYQQRAVTGHVDRFVGSVKNLLGQFSNRDGYPEEALINRSTAALRDSWSNQAAVDGFDVAGVTKSTDEQQAAIQEAMNNVQGGLVNDPSNVFTLARVIYDNATNLNIRRAELVNELSQTVGLVKLMRDVIPPVYYANTSLELLKEAKPQLEEVVRKITLACGAIANGGSPDQLVRVIENDFEVVLRRVAREEVYDAGQFSPTEYLALINRIKAAVEEIGVVDAQLAQLRDNINNYQTNFIDSFQNTFTECGTLSTAQSNITGIIDRIGVICDEQTDNPESRALVDTEEFVLDMAVTLTLIREFVQQKQKFENVLNVDPSPERTSFEASQVAIAAVPTFSSSMPVEALEFARRAERRLTISTVDPEVDTLFTSLSSSIPAAHANCAAFQAALNGYDIDIQAASRRLFITSLEDLDSLKLDRVFDALLLGELTIGFDPDTIKASSIGYALQQAALAFEGGASGISAALGACKVSTRFGQAKISQILADLQSKLQLQVFSRLSFKDLVDKRVEELDDKVIKKLCRALEEIEAIRIFENCE